MTEWSRRRVLEEQPWATRVVVFDSRRDREAVMVALAADAPAQVRERFVAVSKKARRVRHPALPRVLEAGEHAEGMPYVCLEPPLEGETLLARMERGPSLGLQKVVALAGELSGALSALHRAGIAHGDVGPHRIMIDGSSDRTSLIDLELNDVFARAGREDVSDPEALIGLSFMAPEQASRDVIADAAADVYSLAATLFSLLSGRAPRQGDDAAKLRAEVLAGPALSLAEASDVVPPKIAAAIDGALAVDPGARPDAERFARQLQISLTKSRQTNIESIVGPRVMSASPSTASSATVSVPKAAPVPRFDQEEPATVIDAPAEDREPDVNIAPAEPEGEPSRAAPTTDANESPRDAGDVQPPSAAPSAADPDEDRAHDAPPLGPGDRVELVEPAGDEPALALPELDDLTERSPDRISSAAPLASLPDPLSLPDVDAAARRLPDPLSLPDEHAAARRLPDPLSLPDEDDAPTIVDAGPRDDAAPASKPAPDDAPDALAPESEAVVRSAAFREALAALDDIVAPSSGAQPLDSRPPAATRSRPPTEPPPPPPPRPPTEPPPLPSRRPETGPPPASVPQATTDDERQRKLRTRHRRSTFPAMSGEKLSPLLDLPPRTPPPLFPTRTSSSPPRRDPTVSFATSDPKRSARPVGLGSLAAPSTPTRRDPTSRMGTGGSPSVETANGSASASANAERSGKRKILNPSIFSDEGSISGDSLPIPLVPYANDEAELEEPEAEPAPTAERDSVEQVDPEWVEMLPSGETDLTEVDELEALGGFRRPLNLALAEPVSDSPGDEPVDAPALEEPAAPLAEPASEPPVETEPSDPGAPIESSRLPAPPTHAPERPDRSGWIALVIFAATLLLLGLAWYELRSWREPPPPPSPSFPPDGVADPEPELTAEPDPMDEPADLHFDAPEESPSPEDPGGGPAEGASDALDEPSPEEPEDSSGEGTDAAPTVTITLRGVPAGGRIWWAGRPTFRTVFEVDRSETRSLLRVDAPGYRSWSVRVVPSTAQTIVVRMRPGD